CIALFDFLCELDVPAKIEQKVEDFKAAGVQGIANEYSQVWNTVMGVLDQVVEVLGDESLSLDKFGDILSVGLGEYKMGLIPAAIDQVLVGSVERSKSHEVKALFVLGVNDGIFPMSVLDEGILSDRDREILKQKGMELAQDTRTKTFEEQYNIYTTLTTPGSYLRVSYPLADQEGRSMRPSSIIFRLRKLFPHIRETSNIAKAGIEHAGMEMVSSPAPTFNQLISILRKKREGGDINPLWLDVYQWYVNNDIWKEKCKIAMQGLTYRNTLKPVNPDKTKKLYGTPMNASISRLEKFAACPFAYFAQYGLKAKERKILKLSAPDTGVFLHNIIDRFSKHMEQHRITWRTLDREWCSTAVSEIVDDQLSKAVNSVFNSSQRYKFIATRLKRVVSRAVWLIAEHIKRSSFEPIGYEIGFGEGESFPPIELGLSTGDSIKLTGRIDRVDTYKSDEGTYLRVVDYKSGSKAFKLFDVYYGLQIQLITYLSAVLENGGMGIQKPIIPGGILYFKLDDPIIRAENKVSEEEIELTIMKQLKMKGLLLADVKLIKEMDHSIDGDSLIIPARINKGDVLGRSSAASMQQFDMLRKHVEKLLKRLGEEILGGDVSINPYKKKRVTSCMYCNYASICQFDSKLSENNYRILPERKDDEVWELIMGDGAE
ncbi:MAG: ATP-dependent nuclease subunit, partial [Clostridiales bacterium]|nr:ATP-dependent nuclease subunit [Clostridiales bacterium]